MTFTAEEFRDLIRAQAFAGVKYAPAAQIASTICPICLGSGRVAIGDTGERCVNCAGRGTIATDGQK
jgi:DnaJ-class molecular chaperone